MVAERGALRVLETSQAPAIYFPPGDVAEGVLVPVKQATTCKAAPPTSMCSAGAAARRARHGPTSTQAAGTPARLAGDLSPSTRSERDACRLGDELVAANGGDFYGGCGSPAT